MVEVSLEARDSSGATCVFCKDGLAGEAFTCRGCGVVLHPACREELARCPTPGCAQAWPRVSVTPRPATPPQALSGVGRLVFGLALLVIGVAAALFLSIPDTPAEGFKTKAAPRTAPPATDVERRLRILRDRVSTSPNRRTQALFALQQHDMIPEDPSLRGQVLVVLLGTWKDDTKTLRMYAANALVWAHGWADPRQQAQIVDALAAGLRAGDGAIRSSAVAAIGRLGAKAEAAAPALGQVLGDPNKLVRYPANFTLRKMGAAGARAFAGALNHPDPQVRLRALHGLMDIKAAQARVAIPAVRELLDDANAKVQGAAEYLVRRDERLKQ